MGKRANMDVVPLHVVRGNWTPVMRDASDVDISYDGARIEKNGINHDIDRGDGRLFGRSPFRIPLARRGIGELQNRWKDCIHIAPDRLTRPEDLKAQSVGSVSNWNFSDHVPAVVLCHQSSSYWSTCVAS
uniref:Uncharacterized protein n=1 Tax=Spongospora subterranea TaxID=70186 RepID=A0A0H5QYZ3_9EUKA|eukprot:CRZ06896.1 hypothetical protein [Spongospora subterranea]